MLQSVLCVFQVVPSGFATKTLYAFFSHTHHLLRPSDAPSSQSLNYTVTITPGQEPQISRMRFFCAVCVGSRAAWRGNEIFALVDEQHDILCSSFPVPFYPRRHPPGRHSMLSESPSLAMKSLDTLSVIISVTP